MISIDYTDKIAAAVGYDISDESSRNYIKALVDAGIADMQYSGVSDDVINASPLVVTTLIIYVSDNLNMTPGNFVTSSMYISNVIKLRLQNEV